VLRWPWDAGGRFAPGIKRALHPVAGGTPTTAGDQQAVAALSQRQMSVARIQVDEIGVDKRFLTECPVTIAGETMGNLTPIPISSDQGRSVAFPARGRKAGHRHHAPRQAGRGIDRLRFRRRLFRVPSRNRSAAPAPDREGARESTRGTWRSRRGGGCGMMASGLRWRGSIRFSPYPNFFLDFVSPIHSTIDQHLQRDGVLCLR
jgi:hypothetical protein